MKGLGQHLYRSHQDGDGELNDVANSPHLTGRLIEDWQLYQE